MTSPSLKTFPQTACSPMEITHQESQRLFVDLLCGYGWHGPSEVPLIVDSGLRYTFQDREIELDPREPAVFLEFWLGHHEAERELEDGGSWGPAYRVRAKIGYGSRLERLLRAIGPEGEWADPLTLLAKVASSDFDIGLVKGVELLPLTRARLVAPVHPEYDAIDALTFSVGHEAESRFMIERAFLPMAFDALKRWGSKLGQSGSMSCLAGAGNLPDFFWEAADVACRFDGQGNLIGFRHGGDRWVFEWLAPLTEFIREGSFFILQDPGCVLWKVEYGVQGVRYGRERGVSAA